VYSSAGRAVSSTEEVVELLLVSLAEAVSGVDVSIDDWLVVIVPIAVLLCAARLARRVRRIVSIFLADLNVCSANE
jgi:hypothetical protein